MAEEIHILKVEKDGEDGLIVTFSDRTIAGYVVEELLLLRPTEKLSKSLWIQTNTLLSWERTGFQWALPIQRRLQTPPFSVVTKWHSALSRANLEGAAEVAERWTNKCPEIGVQYCCLPQNK
jgi:hypothetical protein